MSTATVVHPKLINRRIAREIVSDMNKRGLPKHMQRAVVFYVLYRLRPGHFLTAVLSNDLVEAIGRGDDTNCALLREWVRLFYNCEVIPGNCWGSKQHVLDWLAGDPRFTTFRNVDCWDDLIGDSA